MGQDAGQKQGQLQVIPAVDVLGNEAVRLEQGDFNRVKIRAGDPPSLVRRYATHCPPLLHLVDLGAARTGKLRPSVIRLLVAEANGVPVQVAGGVRSVEDARQLLAAGASRIVVGTAAFATPRSMRRYVELLGDRLVIAIDVRDDIVAVGGWERSSGLSVTEAVDRCRQSGAERLLCTSIERDGTLRGPDLDLLSRVAEQSRLPILAAGGIGSERNLKDLAALGMEGAIVGRALLEGTITLTAQAPLR